MANLQEKINAVANKSTGNYTPLSPQITPISPVKAEIPVATTSNPMINVSQAQLDAFSQIGKSQVGANPVSITPESLAPANAYKIAETPVTSTANAILGTADAMKIQSQTQQALEADKLAKQTELNTKRSDLSKLQDEILGVQSSRSDLNASQGIDTKTNALNEATKKIETSQRAQANELRALDTQGLTDAQRSAFSQSINRKYAFEQADLGLAQSAANRDLLTAQSIIDNTIKLKLEPLQTRLDFQKTFYDENKSSFDKADQRAFENKLKENERVVNEQKTRLEEISSWTKEAVKNGQSELVSQFSKIDPLSPTFNQDLAKVQSQVTNSDVILDRRLKQAQVNKLQSEADTIVGKNGGNSNDLLAYASDMASTGNLPKPPEVKASGLSVGQVADMARQIPQPKGFIASANTGVKDQKVPSTEQADYQKLYNIIESTKRLKELDAKRTGGVFAGSLGKVFGGTPQGEAQGAYIALRNSIVDDISRMQSGAALSEEEQKFYQDYLPGRLSEPFGLGQNSNDVIDNFNSIMTNRLNERLATNGLQIYGFSTVDLGGRTYKIGDTIELDNGKTGTVLPGGKISTN
jgi:hypothetical protein